MVANLAHSTYAHFYHALGCVWDGVEQYGMARGGTLLIQAPIPSWMSDTCHTLGSSLQISKFPTNIYFQKILNFTMTRKYPSFMSSYDSCGTFQNLVMMNKIMPQFILIIIILIELSRSLHCILQHSPSIVMKTGMLHNESVSSTTKTKSLGAASTFLPSQCFHIDQTWPTSIGHKLQIKQTICSLVSRDTMLQSSPQVHVHNPPEQNAERIRLRVRESAN